MNKRKLNIISLLLIIICSSCNSRDNFGISSSISTSVERKTFICQYISVNNPLIINDTLHLNFGDIFLEKKWRYGKYFRKSTIENGYQLKMVIDKKSYKEFYPNFNYHIGKNPEMYLRSCGSECLMGVLNYIPDTIAYPIYHGDMFSSDRKKVGELLLVPHTPHQ